MAERLANRLIARGTRPLLVGVVVLLGLALVLPLWSTRMEAPQYKDDEVLEVRVYAGRVQGDLHEIELLNQYVGVHLPLDTPELKAAPWIIGGFLALSMVSLALQHGARRKMALVLCVSMGLVLVSGTVLLQYRLYEMGHNRSPSIMTRIPDFTPLVLGSKKIANFTAHMSLGLGAWAFLGAMAVSAIAARSPVARLSANPITDAKGLE